VGKNFDTNPTLNTKVFFDGEDAGAPSPQSTDIFLVVTVPAIPNPPTAGEKEVTVKVQTPLGETTAKYRVTPALAGENPKINSIKTVNAGVAIVNELISIQGDFFDPTPAKNRVSFEGQNTEVAPEVQGSSKTALSVRIPSLPALTGAGALPVVGVNIVVKSKDAEGKDRLSNAVPLTIAK
jgi:hypothetical protein